MEECGLVADVLHKIGILMFEFVGDPQLMEVHVFTTSQWKGTVKESDGGSLGGPCYSLCYSAKIYAVCYHYMRCVRT